MKHELLAKAHLDLRTAEWSMSQSDDLALLVAASHLSQCAEKIVKSCLKELGIPYAKTHRIEDLLYLLPDSQSLLSEDDLSWLEDKSTTLYDWESKTRYTEGYLVTRRHVTRIYNDVSKLYNSVKLRLQEFDKVAGNVSSSDSAKQDAKNVLKKMNIFGDD